MPHSTSVLELGRDTAAPPLGGRSPNTPAIAFAARATLDARVEEIAVICHELRNSLAVIRGAARLLRAPVAPGVIETARLLLDRHAGQMSRHIEDLLEPLRRSQGLQLAHIDLRTIARDAAEGIAPEIVRRGHRLTVQVPEQPIWLHADGARLEQVFSNLLINAAKYTPDGGDIAMVMEQDDQHVCVWICDSGVGIAPAMLSRVFGMFVQVNDAQPSAEGGCGIGLAVVRNLVELHGGTVKALSAGVGFGSQFIVVLPTLWARPEPRPASPGR